MSDHLDWHADADFLLGVRRPVLMHAIDHLSALQASERLWDRDGSLWASHPQAVAEVEQRLGWLDLPGEMAASLPQVEHLAEQVRADGYTQALLLGMGGSSLGPEVLREILGVRPGYLDLRVIDTTDAAEVRHAAETTDLARTLFVVSSKSGSTAETRAQYLYFRAALQALVGEAWAQHFVAITDPGTALAELAVSQGFRALFYGKPDVGGRFSVLSVFGLLPAALLGVDLPRLAAGALAMAGSTRPGQPVSQDTALQFGATLGALARLHPTRRDKLTLLTSPRLASFGAWAEQLVAESTGKNGVGIVPVDGEPPMDFAHYGDDRLFVYLRLDDDDNAAPDALAAELVGAGHPLVYLRLRDLYALGAEFFRWEYATAIAGQLLGVNPFDQPNVEAAKQQARAALAAYEQTHRLEEQAPCLEDDLCALDGPPPLAGEDVAAYLRRVIDQAVQPGGYVALMAYLERSPAYVDSLAGLRAAIGQRTGLATTLGFGPRFLHSTGQLHKGGPAGGLYVQITRENGADLAIPGEPYTFGVLQRAQALGDLAALRQADRQVLRIHLKRSVKHTDLAILERLARILRAGDEPCACEAEHDA